MDEQLERISRKMDQLKALDQGYILFGADSHKYQLHPVLTLDQIRQFEQMYDIVLPEGYVAFITQIGNGGMGPFYGLTPLVHVFFDEYIEKHRDSSFNPDKPFPYTSAWNMEASDMIDNSKDYLEERDKFYRYYASDEHTNGLIPVSNHGCGYVSNLVVNGQAYGFIWMDGRVSDGGLHPDNYLGNTEDITFLDWYELWLDRSIEDVNQQLVILNRPTTYVPIRIEKKPWWKIW